MVIYRKDIWQKAGVTSAPKTIDELNADLDKVKAANSSDPNFSAFYMPGKYWYAAMSLVYGAGGKIAEQKNGKWHGHAGEPAGAAGPGRVAEARDARTRPAARRPTSRRRTR